MNCALFLAVVDGLEVVGVAQAAGIGEGLASGRFYVVVVTGLIVMANFRGIHQWKTAYCCSPMIELVRKTNP